MQQAARPLAGLLHRSAQASRHVRGLATLRVAGVPEHFNAPFHLAKDRGLYAERGVDFQWSCVPQGTGAMAQALEAGSVDVAVMLSEGAVARAAVGAPLKVVGTYVKSPLRWGIHVKKGRPISSPGDLKGKVFGVSRMLSGSHLMAHVFAHQRGWDLELDAPLKVVGTLDGARGAMAKDEIDAWLWEKFTTKHLVDSGEWDIVGEVPTPWPCFLFVASDSAIAERSNEIREMVAATRGVCEEFKANSGGKTLAYVAENHALSQEDAKEWLDGTEWACALEVQESTLQKTQEALITIGQIKEAAAFHTLYNQGLCTLIA
mmetsp:Transcript_102731/g.306923  ORF Transcript_102731/g.306923 Transcript_102731/m.306923 type:complete len:318 (+) Transcript_102731:75-1028(+)